MTRVRAQYLGSRTDDPAIFEVFRSQAGPVGQDLQERAHRVLLAAQATVPRRTNRLAMTLRIEAGDAATGPYRDVTIGRPGITDYTGYVIYGTVPHVIRPVRARALRFLSGGKIVFARKVDHPGTKPHDFMTRALNAAR